MDINKILYRIKELRLQKNLSSAEMGDKLHIDVSAYTRLESGQTNTWGKYLDDLLIIFEISLADFFREIELIPNVLNECEDTPIKIKEKTKSPPLPKPKPKPFNIKIEYDNLDSDNDKDAIIKHLIGIIKLLSEED